VLARNKSQRGKNKQLTSYKKKKKPLILAKKKKSQKKKKVTYKL